MHCVLPYPAAYFPVGHSVNAVLFAAFVYEPGGACWHAADDVPPVFELYVPAVHDVQAATDTEPLFWLYVPAGHGVHDVVDVPPVAAL